MTATATKKQGLALGRLSQVAQIAVSQKPAQPDDVIHINRIYSVKQIRQVFLFIEELAESIKLNGIAQPLLVHAEPDGRYRIIAGERRYRAALLASLTAVPVLIKRGLSPLEIRRLQVAENNDREDLTAYEETMAVIEDVKEYGTKEAMLIWNHKDAWISKRLAYERWAEPVRALLEADQCRDLEILMVLNQIYHLQEEQEHREFERLAALYRSGEAPAREYIRNLRDWLKTLVNHKERNAEKAASDKAKSKNDEMLPAAPVESPSAPAIVSPEPGQTLDAGGEQADIPPPASKMPQTSKATKPVNEASKQQPTDRVLAFRKSLFSLGENARRQARDLVQAAMEQGAQEGFNLPDYDWIIWQAFADVVLPLLDGLGDDRSKRLLKRMQSEVKGSDPAMRVWARMHPEETDGTGRNRAPSRPADWHL